MNVEVVIGANYGDEGKGLVTEFCCRNSDSPLVVLSNGGCQRGHTVNNVENGIRHVFHHFGSGTLLGAPSIYSKTYLLNPIKYIEEKLELEKDGIKPIAFRAPGCILQLPGDMLVNQSLEKHRSKSRTKHGSCGWGIWETILRNKEKPLLFEDFKELSFNDKRSCIIEALDSQITRRLEPEGAVVDNDLYKIVVRDGFIEHFIRDFEEMERDVKVLSTDDLLNVDWGIYCSRDVKTLVIENAQGLLLDKKYAPIDENGKTDVHSTPSKCGLEGALDALGDTSHIDGISIFYVSRAYLTRHGDGPFHEEDISVSFPDKTNMPNEYQGSLRFGLINESTFIKMKRRIAEDSSIFEGAEVNLVATHMNEIKNPFMLDDASHFSYDDNSANVM